MDHNHEGTAGKAVFVPPMEGSRVWVTDELITFVVTSGQTGGKYSLTDSVVPPHGGPPPHIHSREDEAFWILEGELEITVGEERFRASAGSFVHLPKGMLHSYQNVGAAPARFLTLMVPAGLERFFQEVGKPADSLSSPPMLDEGDVEQLIAVASKYGVHIPPPPAA